MLVRETPRLLLLRTAVSATCAIPKLHIPRRLYTYRTPDPMNHDSRNDRRPNTHTRAIETGKERESYIGM